MLKNKINREVDSRDRVFLEWTNLTLNIPVTQNRLGTGFKSNRYIKPLLKGWNKKMEEQIDEGLPNGKPRRIDKTKRFYKQIFYN